MEFEEIFTMLIFYSFVKFHKTISVIFYKLFYFKLSICDSTLREYNKCIPIDISHRILKNFTKVVVWNNVLKTGPFIEPEKCPGHGLVVQPSGEP